MNSRKFAFTLIELLIVVAIIAILAAIAVPNFLEAQTRSKVSRARADMRTMVTALETYRIDSNRYPPMLGTIPAGQVLNATNFYGNARLNGWRGLPQNLTTPVAYITSIVPDVFKVGKTANLGPDIGKSYNNGNPFDASFVYHNIRQYFETQGPPNWTQADLNDYGDFRMFSLGPDGKYNPVGTADPTKGWVYDASNGTISSGMILRTQIDPVGEKFSQ